MLDSAALGTGLYATIYTPACYDPTGKYPVLYLLHGQNMDDNFWFDMGATRIAEKAIRAGQAPFLIVMPYEERMFDPPGDSMFYDALLNDLIPWVDAHFATCTERVCRAIGGVSRGGGWAIRLVMRNFETFGALGAHSFGLMQADTWWAQKNLETHSLAEFPRIYLDRGDKDYLAEDIEYFENALSANKIPHEYHIYPGIHNKDYWQAHVEEYMQFYMAAW
ncbi:MAG: putative esterase family protein [Chloroflexi bacterium]|nr:MAG: putative esterase family protein [Chloroflexota bacterium]